jgi:hypothetical protein
MLRQAIGGAAGGTVEDVALAAEHAVPRRDRRRHGHRRGADVAG